MLDCHLISIFGYSSSRKLNNICGDLTDKHLSGAHHCSLQQVRSALHSFQKGVGLRYHLSVDQREQVAGETWLVVTCPVLEYYR